MDLGSKIKAARLEAGLSQRQLCGDRLTRNMLSQIENGSARPSMKTLEFLARRLGKSVSYFLEEQAVTSPNRQAMTDARAALERSDLPGLRQALDAYREPDAVYDPERQLLEFLWHKHRGEQALKTGAVPYGVKLLRRALDMEGIYITEENRARCRVLLGLAGERVEPVWDEEALLVKAAQTGNPQRRLEILEAGENREDPRWLRLRGEALMALKRYPEAEACCRKLPRNRQVLSRLEICCRELGDYKGAYEYACLQRE